MSGSLYESHKSVAEALDGGDQQLLSDFSDIGQTFIGIADADSEISDICHEMYPSLTVQGADRKRYYQYRSGFVTNSAVDNPSRRAYEEAGISESHREHVVDSEQAQKALSSIVRHLKSGDDVTLIFQSKLDERAHGSVLVQMIESRMESRYSFSPVIV